jgi:protein TonB
MIPERARRAVLGWGAALVAVALAHGAGLEALRRWITEHPPEPPPEPALLLDLPPLAPERAKPEPPPPEAPKPELPKPPPPTPEPPKPEPPKPAPPPEPPKPRLVKPPQPTPPKKAERPAPAETSDAVAPQPAPEPATPPAAASSIPPAWRALIAARIERMKRYPRAALLRRDQGTVVLRFAIDRDGNVLSADIVRSSGAALLDEEAMLLARRVSPLPPPPPEVPGGRIELTVPIHFAIQ